VKERERLEELNVEGRIKLKCIFKTLNERAGENGVDSSGSGWGQVAGCCESGNEHSSSIKCGKFLGHLRNY
jgi:hypothetical protein